MKNPSTLAVLYAAAFCSHISIGLLLPTIPEYTDYLEAPESLEGLIVNAFSLSMALFLIPFGLLSDKLGRRRVLVTGLVLFAVGHLIYPQVSSPWLLFGARAVHGVACAAFIPAMAGLLIDLAHFGERGKTLGRFGAAALLGVAVGPAFGGVVLRHWDFDAVFYVAGLVPVIGLGLVLWKFAALSGQPEDTVAESDHSWGWLRKRRGIASLLVPFFLTVGSGIIYTYIGGYVEPFGIEEDGAGFIIAIMYFSSALSRAPAGTMSDRVGRKPIILFGLLVSVVSVVLVPSLESFTLLSVAALCFGVGMGMAMTPSAALLADVVPSGARGRAMGTLNTALHAGLFAGPALIGPLAATSGYGVMFRTCALALAGGLLLVFVLLRQPAGESCK